LPEDLTMVPVHLHLLLRSSLVNLTATVVHLLHPGETKHLVIARLSPLLLRKKRSVTAKPSEVVQHHPRSEWERNFQRNRFPSL
jgi:hypothetical protein